MFNPTALLIDAFVEQLQQAYWRTYSNREVHLLRHHRLGRADGLGKYRQ